MAGGTSPGINLIYAHLNRLIRRYEIDMFLFPGPGHGTPANLANLYLEGSLHEFYPQQPTLKRLYQCLSQKLTTEQFIQASQIVFQTCRFLPTVEEFVSAGRSRNPSIVGMGTVYQSRYQE